MPLSDDEYRRLVRQASRAIDDANRVFRSGVFELFRRNAATLQRASAWAERNQSLLRRIPEFVEATRRAAFEFERDFRRALPPNWEPLTTPEVFDLIYLIRETGFSLAWAPRAEIVRTLLEAEPEDRDESLLLARADVLEDLEAVIADISSPRLRDIPSGLRAAVRALRDGHDEAAQALATVIFTGLIHGPLRFKGHGEARDKFRDDDLTDTAISHLRLRAIALAGVEALADFNPQTMRPRHERYNRHASAHSYLCEQYTQLSALVAVLLVVTLARECDYWLTTHGELPTAL